MKVFPAGYIKGLDEIEINVWCLLFTTKVLKSDLFFEAKPMLGLKMSNFADLRFELKLGFECVQPENKNA